MIEKYIKASECEKYFYEHLDDNGMIGAMNAIDEMPAADVQPVDKITKIIQARLRGIQKIQLYALQSSDFNTAYKMTGAVDVCNAILEDLEAIKG